MNRDRMSGVLLHITSLPSRGGVGDFGPAAYAFVDFLAAAKQRLWQVLPLRAAGYGSSPYSAVSAFAGNPALISLERLVDEGGSRADRVEKFYAGDAPVENWSSAREAALIEEAAGTFSTTQAMRRRRAFQNFCQENMTWLPDYASFMILRRRFGNVSWNEVAGGVCASQARR